MKLIGVTLLAFWLGICLGSENRISSIDGIPDYAYERGLRQQENGRRQLGNELTNSRGSPVIDGIPGFIYDAGLRRQENKFSQDVSRKGINGQSIDSNSATDDKNILTQRFQYQEVPNRNEFEESPSPAMTYFQIPEIQHSSQDSSFHSQNNDVFRASPEFRQTSTATRFQESEIRQPSSTTGFPTSQLRQSSEASGFRSPSQQFEIQESELQTKKRDEAMAQARQSPQFKAQETDSRVSSVFQPSSISTFQRPGARQPFESIPTMSKSQVEQFSLQSTHSRSKPSPQPQRFETAQDFDTKTISQFPQTIESTLTQVSEARQHLKPTLQHEYQHSQISQSPRFADQEIETEAQNRFPAKQPSITQFQDYTRQTPDQHRQSQQETETKARPQFPPSPVPRVQSPNGQHFQSQQFATQETEVKSQPRFPPVSSSSHFQTQPEPSFFQAQRDDTKETQLSKQEPETKSRPQFSPSPVPRVQSSNGQTFQSQQFATKETEVKSHPRFPPVSAQSHFQTQPEPSFFQTQRDDTKGTQLSKQEPETKTRPQFSPSPVPRVQSPNGQTFQSQQFATQETEVKSHPRFPPASSPSHFQTQPEPSFFQTQRDDTKETQLSKQEPETKATPQFSPSLVLRVHSPNGQTFQSQQFATQETEVKSQPQFPTQDQRHQLQHLSEQEIETKARPQFPQSPVSKVSDTRQTSEFKVEEKERQTFQSQQTDVRAQTRLPSAPSAFQETKQPLVTADALKIRKEEAVATAHDRKFPTQQIASIESERKTSTRVSSPKVSHFQAAGTRPIVRQESLSIPQSFQVNLFRDVGYASPPVQNRPNVALVRSHSIGPTDERAYAFIFESEDGIIREEQGGSTDPEKGLTAKTGSFSYISPDGTIVETTYIADERGYRTQSAPLARIHDPDLPAGKYDRYRSALALSQRNSKPVENQKARTLVQ